MAPQLPVRPMDPLPELPATTDRDQGLANPWHPPYAALDPHQHRAPFVGGHGVALPRAASVVAYWGRSEASAGEVASEAAKAS